MKTSTQWWSVRKTAGLALVGCLVVAMASSGGAADDPAAAKKADAKPAVDTSKKTSDVKPAADTSKKTTDVKPAADTGKKDPDAKPAVEGGKEEAAGGLDNRDRRILGYTRPGVPDDKVVNGIIPAAPRDSLGGTVYYKVLELGTGAAADYWWPQGKGEFNDKFHPGEKSAPLDRTARYLYLYQTFNDRHTDRSVRRTTIKLLVDPVLITSWGYFEGVGFAVEQGNAIRPINSTTVTGVANNVYERVFLERSPAYLPGKVLQFGKIESKTKDAHRGLERLIANDPTEGVNPDRVLILPVSEFEDSAPYRQPRGALPVYGPMPNLFGCGCLPPLWTGYRADMAGGYGPLAEVGNVSRTPAFRAEWRYELERSEWSPVYGFTSNQPPTLEALRLLGLRAAKGGEGVIPVGDEGVAGGAVGPAGSAVAPAGGVVGAAAGPDGEVATPVAAGSAAPLSVGMGGGSLGGMAPGLGGAGGGLGGIAGVPLGTGLGTGTTGGGAGSGGGTGSGNGTPAQTQAQQQPTSQNQIVNVNVKQKQQQQQQQQQQSNNGNNSNVVPEPSAVLLALLGLPFLLLFARRKTAPQSA